MMESSYSPSKLTLSELSRAPTWLSGNSFSLIAIDDAYICPEPVVRSDSVLVPDGDRSRLNWIRSVVPLAWSLALLSVSLSTDNSNVLSEPDRDRLAPFDRFNPSTSLFSLMMRPSQLSLSSTRDAQDSFSSLTSVSRWSTLCRRCWFSSSSAWSRSGVMFSLLGDPMSTMISEVSSPIWTLAAFKTATETLPSETWIWMKKLWDNFWMVTSELCCLISKVYSPRRVPFWKFLTNK